jgi:hypothetical protein
MGKIFEFGDGFHTVSRVENERNERVVSKLLLVVTTLIDSLKRARNRLECDNA